MTTTLYPSYRLYFVILGVVISLSIHCQFIMFILAQMPVMTSDIVRVQ